MKRKKIIAYFTLIAGCVAMTYFAIQNNLDWVQIVSALVAVLGVILLAIELYQSRKITEAEFLANLNQAFVSNEDYKTAYALFEKYDFDALPDLELENYHISNYLTFFEVFQLLLERGTLTIDMINDLFGYRFFIAVHNPYVQRQKIVKSPENFRNIYILEREWVAYRKKRGMPVFHEEYSLEAVVPPEVYRKAIAPRRK